MNNYVKVESASNRGISEYLTKGWEIIETTKSSYDGIGNDTAITYHVGYPITKKCEELLSIIRLYESRGFKEKLFDILAEEEGVKLEDYSEGFGIPEENGVFNTIKKYEFVVNDKEVSYYKNRNFDKMELEF